MTCSRKGPSEGEFQGVMNDQDNNMRRDISEIEEIGHRVSNEELRYTSYMKQDSERAQTNFLGVGCPSQSTSPGETYLDVCIRGSMISSESSPSYVQNERSDIRRDCISNISRSYEQPNLNDTNLARWQGIDTRQIPHWSLTQCDSTLTSWSGVEIQVL